MIILSWKVLPHPSFSPDLSLNLYLFGTLKDRLRVQNFVHICTVTDAVKKYSATAGQILPGWHRGPCLLLAKCIENGGNHLEKKIPEYIYVCCFVDVTAVFLSVQMLELVVGDIFYEPPS